MTSIQRLTPSMGASMRRDDEGPYVRYLDHIEALAQAEARSVQQRAALSTIPLDMAAERLRAENARLCADVAALRARLQALNGSAEADDLARSARHSGRCG